MRKLFYLRLKYTTNSSNDNDDNEISKNKIRITKFIWKPKMGKITGRWKVIDYNQ